MSMMLVVGLGNPGAKYAGHRHNIGFMAIDAIVRHHGMAGLRPRFQGEYGETRLETSSGVVKLGVLKPQTFMNESGRSVGEAARFYKLDPAQIAVLYDELDLAPGKFRLKLGGGAAGHNGIRSVTSAIGPDYHRGRMGIGHPGSKDRVLGHVLSDFYKGEQPWVEALCEAIARSIDLFAAGHGDKFQTQVTHLAPAPKSNSDAHSGSDSGRKS